MIDGSVLAGVAVLADGDNAFGAGFIAFVVVMALCLACYFLFRSMNRHLKGLPTTFPAPPSPPAEDEEPTATPVQTPPASDA
jgi:hypothetical protein